MTKVTAPCLRKVPISPKHLHIQVTYSRPQQHVDDYRLLLFSQHQMLLVCKQHLILAYFIKEATTKRRRSKEIILG